MTTNVNLHETVVKKEFGTNETIVTDDDEVLFFLHERIHDSTILSINTPSSEIAVFYPNLSFAKPRYTFMVSLELFLRHRTCFEHIRLIVRVIFSRHVIGSRITRRIPSFSLYLSRFSYILFFSYFFSLTFIFSDVFHSFAHLSQSSTQRDLLRSLYPTMIYLHVTYTSIYRLDFLSHTRFFLLLHPFIRWRGRGCIFRVRLQSVLFYHHFTESDSSVSTMRADVLIWEKFIYSLTSFSITCISRARYVYR